ncbi:hypothetical protein IWX90DRAFT_304736 [Phyllosticta citrichinensis]|uniref:Uncharacterized protein n=1 Tax=Phyllosticta citrichinensis TaxID=1130410 RepID=A0ABR1XLH4_9PEZI
MTFPWHRRSTHQPWYSTLCSCLSSSCMHTRRHSPDSAPYAIVQDQENERDLLITRPQLAWVRRGGDRGGFFRARLPTRRSALRHAEDELEREACGFSLRGGGDSTEGEVCCCGARSFGPLTRGCACCQERGGFRGRGSRGSDICVHVTRRRSWGWGRTTQTRRRLPSRRNNYDDRTPILDRGDFDGRDFLPQTRRLFSRGPPLQPRSRISNLADRFSDLAVNLGRLSPPPFLSSRSRLRPSLNSFNRSRSRRRLFANRSPSTPRTIPLLIPRSRSHTRSNLRARHEHSPRSRRFHRSRSLSRSLTPRSGSFRLGTSRSPPPTVRFRTPTPSPPISAASTPSFMPSRRRGAVSALSGPPPMHYADLGRNHERERRPYLRRGNRLSPPYESRSSFGLSPSRGQGRRSPLYRGSGLSSDEDNGMAISLDQLRRGRSMRRRCSPSMRDRSGAGYLDDEDSGSVRTDGLHLPRIQRRYAMPAAREREREMGFGGRLRGEEGWRD